MTGAPPQERLSLKWSAHVSEVEVNIKDFIQLYFLGKYIWLFFDVERMFGFAQVDICRW